MEEPASAAAFRARISKKDAIVNGVREVDAGKARYDAYSKGDIML